MNKKSCGKLDDVLTLLLETADSNKQAQIKRHLEACPECRRFYAENKALVADIRHSYTSNQPDTDQRAAVFDRINASKQFIPLPAYRWLKAAAVLLFASALAFLLNFNENRTTEEMLSTADNRIHSSLEWLADTQQPDGSWSPAEWQGRESFRIGLSATALLGISQSDSSGKHKNVCAKAAAYLATQQNSSGIFGDHNEVTMYNHALATYALLQHSGYPHDGPLKNTLDRALNFITSRQHSFGGWGYDAENRATPPNAAVTIWQLQALHAARNAGWQDRTGSYNRGVMWLSSLLDDAGRPGYRHSGDAAGGTPALMAGVNFCLTQAAQHLQDLAQPAEHLPAAINALLQKETVANDLYEEFWLARNLSLLPAELRNQRAEQQSRRINPLFTPNGRLAGSWSPDTTWGRIGGRLYSTAFATLALSEGNRG